MTEKIAWSGGRDRLPGGNQPDFSLGSHHPVMNRVLPLLIRIPLNSCTVGKAPPVHPYREIRIFSYSFQSD
ncbi:hypothetical protein DVJ83_01775 [Deinococcus wulumuqiensis]|uniref:Uncharacterized protein n=1 Tax=Deinococcus wulumuqiensis TaxID=980427 RepID=A0A345IEH7_9DEIO|nr:hypothetical protein DVJ83_01775 [Deinococcus wulumuqiensis]